MFFLLLICLTTGGAVQDEGSDRSHQGAAHLGFLTFLKFNDLDQRQVWARSSTKVSLY